MHPVRSNSNWRTKQTIISCAELDRKSPLAFGWQRRGDEEIDDTAGERMETTQIASQGKCDLQTHTAVDWH
jgi:hypothetical protein